MTVRRLVWAGVLVVALGAPSVGSGSWTTPASAATVQATPTITTDATRYPPGSTVTYHGTGWQGCDSIRVNTFPGFTIATGITPDGTGAFSGTFTAAAPLTPGTVELAADTSLPGFPQCRAHTTFEVAPPTLSTDATQYVSGSTVTYTGTGWQGCDSIRVNTFPGLTIATGISPVNGSFSGTFTAAAPVIPFTVEVAADTSLPGFPQCRAHTTFEVVASLGGPTVSLSKTTMAFGSQRVGTFGNSQVVTVKNTSAVDLTFTDIALVGAHPMDYFGTTDCAPPTGLPAVLHGGQSCDVELAFAPLAFGARNAQLKFVDDAATSPQIVTLTGNGSEGYLLARHSGGVAAFGDAVFQGDASRLHLKAPIVSLATTPSGDGYWLLGGDGGIFAFGDASFFGSTGAIRLNKPVVGLAPTATGHGYWLVASDGGIFAFGDAGYFGSMGGSHLNKPVVGMAATPSGAGYWLVASDGGIFSFGDARFFGSTGAIRLSKPINGMAATPDSNGYWLVASDGGIFAFGSAGFFGSTGAMHVGTIVGMATTPNGHGYWLGSAGGGVFAFGNAPFFGSLGGVTDVAGIAATAPQLPPELLSFAASRAAAALGTAPLRDRGGHLGLPRSTLRHRN
jgi:hypothetical protein